MLATNNNLLFHGLLAQSRGEEEFKPTKAELAVAVTTRMHEDRQANLGGEDDLAVYLRPMKAYPMVSTHAQWADLFARYKAGDVIAHDELVYRNIRLVVSVAIKYSRRGLPLLDCVQEGVIGLLTAIKRFEIERGYQFSTYATGWIRQAITRAIEDTGDRYSYRIPVHMAEQISVVRGCMAHFVKTYGEWPTPLDVYKLVKSRKTQVVAAMTLVDTKNCMKYVQFGESERLDREVSGKGGEEEGRFGDKLPDRRVKTTTVVDASKMLPRYHAALERVEKAVKALPARDAMVLSMRLGLGSFDSMTLEEVAERYELTRERIRQIEEKAYEKLAEAGFKISHEQIQQLQDVLDELERIVRSV